MRRALKPGCWARPGVTRGWCCRTFGSGAAVRMCGKKGVTVLWLLSDVKDVRPLLEIGCCDAEIYELKTVKTKMIVLVLNVLELFFFFFFPELGGQLDELLLCASSKQPSLGFGC